MLECRAEAAGRLRERGLWCAAGYNGGDVYGELVRARRGGGGGAGVWRAVAHQRGREGERDRERERE